MYGRHAEGDKKNSMPPAGPARTALAACNLLRVDAGWLSPKAGRWLTQSAGGLPAGFEVVDQRPVTRVLESPLGKVGVVFFPEGPLSGKGPLPEQAEAALEAGRSLARSCALVIGVSPWGYVGERDFLPRAQGVFSCIFGGGEGVGFGFSVPDKQPGLLWLRPDSRGRAVNVLELYALPPKGGAWAEKRHFEAWLEFLDASFASDPAVLGIVGKAPG